MKHMNYLILFSLTAFLSACGGGGGSTPDTQAPVITLIGAANLTVAHGSVFADPGAAVSDDVDTGLTASVAGSVNTAAIGTYTLTYNATDSAGNVAASVTRTVEVTDQTAPVITLAGATTETVAHGSAFTDAGASVTDNIDVGLTATVTGSVNTAVVGTYTLTYASTDSALNTASVTRTVNVTDQTAPVITLAGAQTLTVAQGSAYVDAGSSVSDNIDTGLTAVVTGSVNTAVVGTYTLTYTSTDAASNTSTVTRTVNVTDQTAPVITLIGAASLTVAHGSVYADAGATVSDNVDVGLVATHTGSVNTSAVGTYTLTYNVSDAATNAATAVTRTVNVTDQTAPAISLNGAASVNVYVNKGFTDLGANVSDNVDIGLTATVTGAVNTAVIGVYTLTYNVSDAATNAATPVTRTVNVIADVTPPVISLIGASTITLTYGSVFTDPGTTVSDNADVGLTATVTGSVNTTLLGNTTLTYNVSDSSGNAATAVTRVVNVTLAAPVPALTFGMKQMQFSWPAVPGADHYRILSNPDGISGFTLVPGAGAIAGLNHNITIAAHLMDWVSAQFLVEACNLSETVCVGSSNQTITPANSIAAMGFFKASNTASNDSFGIQVSISGDGNTLAVGASDEDGASPQINGVDNNLATNAGAVYVFVNNAGVWSQQAYVKASNLTAGDNFGRAVSLSGDGNTLAVGAPLEDGSARTVGGASDDLALDAGAVYVFNRSVAGAWSQHSYVKPSSNDPGDQFGFSVALSSDGNTLAVGAYLEDGSATGVGNAVDNLALDAGAVTVFTKNLSGVWSEHSYIKASNTGAGDSFGVQVALSADGATLAVGAHNEDSSTTTINSVSNEAALNAGAVYVFALNTNIWAEQAYVKASNAGAGDSFGRGLALSADGNTMAVGAYLEDGITQGISPSPAHSNNSSPDKGAAYVYIRNFGVWTEQAYAKPDTINGIPNAFGLSLTLSADGNILVVGAPFERGPGLGVGAPVTWSNLSFDNGCLFTYVRNAGVWSTRSYAKPISRQGRAQLGYSVSISADGQTLVGGANIEASSTTGVGGAPNTAAANAGAVYLY